MQSDLLDEFPELPKILVKLKESDRSYKRRYGDNIVMSILSAISEKDGEIIMLTDRYEHCVNKELENGVENGLNMLAALSRLRYKVNKFMDRK